MRDGLRRHDHTALRQRPETQGQDHQPGRDPLTFIFGERRRPLGIREQRHVPYVLHRVQHQVAALNLAHSNCGQFFQPGHFILESGRVPHFMARPTPLLLLHHDKVGRRMFQHLLHLVEPLKVRRGAHAQDQPREPVFQNQRGQMLRQDLGEVGEIDDRHQAQSVEGAEHFIHRELDIRLAGNRSVRELGEGHRSHCRQIAHMLAHGVERVAHIRVGQFRHQQD